MNRNRSRSRNRNRSRSINRNRSRSRNRNRNRNTTLVEFEDIKRNHRYLINCNNTGFREATIFRKIRDKDGSESIMFQFISNNSQRQEELQVIDYKNCLIKRINTNENLLLRNFGRLGLN